MTWSEPLVLTETYHITFGTRLSSGSWCTTSTLDTKKSIKVTKIERNVKYYIQELRKSHCWNRLRLSLNWLKGKFLNHTFQNWCVDDGWHNNAFPKSHGRFWAVKLASWTFEVLFYHGPRRAFVSCFSRFPVFPLQQTQKQQPLFTLWQFQLETMVMKIRMSTYRFTVGSWWSFPPSLPSKTLK